MTMSARAKKIVAWREYLSLLPDELFFYRMRIYLGEIKTPYNKQNLIESLSAFLRKDEHKKVICSLLGPHDIQILSLIHEIENPTEDTISKFFLDTNGTYRIRPHLINLEDRLLFFRIKNPDSASEYLAINPLLEESLAPFLSISSLFCEEKNIQPCSKEHFSISPLYIACVLSFINDNATSLHNDGALRKKTAEKVAAIFGEEAASSLRISLLIKALDSLKLIREEERQIVVDWKRIQSFATLQKNFLYTYLAVASSAQFFRSAMCENAQTLYSALKKIPEGGCTVDSLVRFFMLQKITSQKRHSIASYSFSVSRDSSSDSSFFKNALHFCIQFGILYLVGFTKDKKEIYTLNKKLFPNDKVEESDLKNQNRAVSINAGLGITIEPFLSLSDLIPLAEFLSVTRYDTVAIFEITRKSVFKAFAVGATPESIILALEKNSVYPVPQSMKVRIEEWFSAYNSAKLYKGYVLRLSDEELFLAKKNQALSLHIKEELSKNVFFMDFKNESEALAVLSQCGIELNNTVLDSSSTTESLPWPPLYEEEPVKAPLEDNAVPFAEHAESRAAFQKELIRTVENMQANDEQKEELISRIQRRIIICPEQLNVNSIRFEIKAARGMDFSGKIHILETALQNQSPVEIGLANGTEIVTGVPISFTKKTSKAEVLIRTEKDGSEKKISVGSATYVKKIYEDIDF